MNILTLDVGGTAIKSSLFVDDKLTEYKELPSRGKDGGEAVLARMHEVIRSYDSFEMIGISTTGQVNSEEGYIVYANENVPNYTGMKLQKIMEDTYKCPVVIENDVNAAGIGEAYFGAGAKFKDFLCITYGTGIGGSIIFDKEVYKGSSNVAGELGHIITHPGGKVCGCGMKGCYEQYASTTSLVENAAKRNASVTNGRILFELFEQQDKDMKIVVDEWIDEIVLGIISLVHIFNPPCVVLGGGVMGQAYVTGEIQRRLVERVMNSFSAIEALPAKLGNHAGMYGMYAIAKSQK